MIDLPKVMYESTEFKPVKGYDGLYWINPKGDVWGIKRNKMLKPQINRGKRSEYLFIDLTLNHKRKRVMVHRLVAETFLPIDDTLLQVNHKDGNKLNNCVDNLEWLTASENMKHAYRTGLKKPGGVIKKWLLRK